MNVDDDYDMLKSMHCYSEGLVSQNVKDTRRLSVHVMNKLGDPNEESATICSNLLRGVKSKMNRSQEHARNSDSIEEAIETNTEPQERTNDTSETISTNRPPKDNETEAVEAKKRGRNSGYFKPHIELSSRRKLERMKVTKDMIISVANPSSFQDKDYFN